MDYSFLVLLSVVAVSCNKNLKTDKLDLAAKSDNVGVHYYERDFDNVFYSYFKPKQGTPLRSVYDQKVKVWEPLDQNESCKYALLAHKNDQPYLLYLLLVGAEGTSDEFYNKEGNSWKKISNVDYNQHLQAMKKSVTNRYVSMFFTTADYSPYYNLYNFSGKTDYKFLSLKKSLSCFNVFYKSRVWVSPNKQDRCVAVWAYKVNSDDYNFLRLLISKADGTSELVSFKKNTVKWVKYNEENKEPGVPDLRFAENLLHPEYDFVDKKAEVFFPSTGKSFKEPAAYNNDPEVLDIDPNVNNIHVRTDHDFLDDVFYFYYQPKSNWAVSKISCASQQVWTSYLYETLKHALVVYDDSGPAMAYLLLNHGNEIRSLVMRKEGGVWKRTDLHYYLARIRSLRSETKIFNYRKLDLYKNFDTRYFDVSFSSNYVFYTPKLANRISDLLYNNHKVWSTKNRERCVAVMAYQGGKYFLLKLLVTNDVKSEVLLYYRMNDKFVKVDSLDVRRDSDGKRQYFINVNGNTHKIDEAHGKLAMEPPYDFYYPQYEFSPKVPEIDFTQPSEKYEPLFDPKKEYEDRFQKDYMKNFLQPLYPLKDCDWLDVANFDKTVGTFTKATFDGVLEVGYMEPHPGKYFSEISENGVKMYSRQLPSEASIGVTFYMNKGAFLLADVLLANRRPASIHLQKYKGQWRYVTKEEFENLLADYRKSLQES